MTCFIIFQLMHRRDTVRLDANSLEVRLHDSGMKQYVLAARIGVHPRTVSRWRSGYVTRISRDNLARLADQLGCRPVALTLADDEDLLATSAEQQRAAREIADRDLLQLLSPTDNWRLAAQLIRATMEPGLPLYQLGRLYNLLSVATWRQGDYDEARRYSLTAREHGERSCRECVVHRAELNLAILDSFLGNNASALQRYRGLVASPQHFELRRDYGNTLANLSMTLRDMASFSEALDYQRRACAVYRELDANLNLAISFAMRMIIQKEVGKLRPALASSRRCREYARQCGFQRQLDQIEFEVADAESLMGRRAEAVTRIEAALPRLASHEWYDFQVHESAARVFRRVGEHKRAREQAALGISLMDRWPLMQGMMYQEQARLAIAEGRATAERGLRRKANAIFRRIQLEHRIRDVPVVEFGEMFG